MSSVSYFFLRLLSFSQDDFWRWRLHFKIWFWWWRAQCWCGQDPRQCWLGQDPNTGVGYFAHGHWRGVNCCPTPAAECPGTVRRGQLFHHSVHVTSFSVQMSLKFLFILVTPTTIRTGPTISSFQWQKYRFWWNIRFRHIGFRNIIVACKNNLDFCCCRVMMRDKKIFFSIYEYQTHCY